MTRLLLLLLLLAPATGWGATTLDTTGYWPFCAQATDGTYLYGHKGNADANLYRSTGSGAPSSVFTFTGSSPYVADVVTTTDGTVFVSASAGGYRFLHKSTDHGATFRQVMEFGLKEDASKIQSVGLLRRSSFGEATVGGQTVLLVGEYGTNAVAGDANDQIRILRSTDGGETWSVLIRWNTNGARQVRHVHAIRQDPTTGYIYIGTGDSGNEAAIIRWDGVSAWPPDNTAPSSALFNAGGFVTVYGAQRYRVCDFLFAGGRILTFSDTTTTGERGIWRATPDLATYELVDSTITDLANHSGYLGAKMGSTLVFSDFLEAGATDLRTYFWTSADDGVTWARVATWGHDVIANTQGMVPYGAGLVYSSKGAGKDEYATALVAPGAAWRSGDEVVRLHPVYWVGTWDAAGSDTNNGYSPATPWATLGKALRTDLIVNGGRVRLAAGSYAEPSILPDWDTSVRQGQGGVLVEGQGRDRTTVYSAGGATYLLSINVEEAASGAPLRFKNLSLDNRGGTTYVCRLQASTVVEFDRCAIGSTSDPNNSTLILSGAGASLRVTRSILTKAAAAAYYLIEYATGIVASATVEYSSLTGANTQILMRTAGSSLSATNSTFAGYATQAVYVSSGSTVVPTTKNCAFAGAGGSVPMVDAASLTETDADIDYNVYNYAVPSLANSGGTHSITADPQFVSPSDYRLRSTSPARDAGTVVTGLHDQAGVVDLAGKPLRGSGVDIGAYEYQGGSGGGRGPLGMGLGLPSPLGGGRLLPLLPTTTMMLWGGIPITWGGTVATWTP